MADLFRLVGIYSPFGQLYEPEDSGQISYYKESKNGQILEEGINEAGAIASWLAAGTSYSTNGLAMAGVASATAATNTGRRYQRGWSKASTKLSRYSDSGSTHRNGTLATFWVT